MNSDILFCNFFMFGLYFGVWMECYELVYDFLWLRREKISFKDFLSCEVGKFLFKGNEMY